MWSWRRATHPIWHSRNDGLIESRGWSVGVRDGHHSNDGGDSKSQARTVGFVMKTTAICLAYFFVVSRPEQLRERQLLILLLLLLLLQASNRVRHHAQRNVQCNPCIVIGVILNVHVRVCCMVHSTAHTMWCQLQLCLFMSFYCWHLSATFKHTIKLTI